MCPCPFCLCCWTGGSFVYRRLISSFFCYIHNLLFGYSRYTSSKAKGRADFDWSAIGLSVAEDAGIDVSADVKRNREDVDKGNTY